MSGDDFVPTTLEELANIATPDAIKQKMLENISNFDDWDGDWQLHHVNTRDAISKSKFIEEVVGIEEYAGQINSEDNLIALSTSGKDSVTTGLNQHRGNHSPQRGYSAAVDRLHEDLYQEYRLEIRGRPPEEIPAIKSQYKQLFYRATFVLKEGHVASIHGTGDVKPAYPIYGTDLHLLPSEKGWANLDEQIYGNLNLATLRESSDFLRWDGSGDFLVSEESFQSYKQDRINSGIFDAGHVNADGHLYPCRAHKHPGQ
jgi:hypothetical protein